MLTLQERSCHNINLVTPKPVAAGLLLSARRNTTGGFPDFGVVVCYGVC